MSTFEDLIQQVKNGNTQKVEEIVNSGVNINNKGSNGLTPLCTSISKGIDEMVKKLLDLGADITQNCALFSAPEHNSDDKVDEISSTPIFLALDRHRINIIEMFLNNAKEKGLNDYINFQRPFDGATILLVSVNKANDFSDENYSLITKLLEYGANPNIRSTYGNTPLLDASALGIFNIVKKLLEFGADPNIPNKDGWTPLMIASNNGYSEIVKLLLTKGADVNYHSGNNITAISLASRNGHNDIKFLLINKGADPKYIEKTEKKITPLSIMDSKKGGTRKNRKNKRKTNKRRKLNKKRKTNKRK
jgi:serine/threonine-protein phosphatase 6 regulatory ankyrin repeat subunit B